MTLEEAQQLLGVYRTQRDHAEQENEKLRKRLSACLQTKELFKQRCWALALLLYPNGEGREAVPGDLGIGFDEHPKTNEEKS